MLTNTNDNKIKWGNNSWILTNGEKGYIYLRTLYTYSSGNYSVHDKRHWKVWPFHPRSWSYNELFRTLDFLKINKYDHCQSYDHISQPSSKTLWFTRKTFNEHVPNDTTSQQYYSIEAWVRLESHTTKLSFQHVGIKVWRKLLGATHKAK